MSEIPPKEDSLSDAFRKLGVSLVETIHVAWNSPERKKFQDEIETGLTDFSDTIKKEMDTLIESPTGQQMKSEFDDLKERVSTGEVENQLRQELLKALSIANTELEKVATRLRQTGSKSPSEAPQEQENQDDAPPAAD